MLNYSDAITLSGEDTLIANPEIHDTEEINKIKNKMSLIHQGFAVHITDCKTCDDSNGTLAVKVTLYSSINGMPVWGDVTLRLTKQAAFKMKNLISSKDTFIDDEMPITTKKKHQDRSQSYF